MFLAGHNTGLLYQHFRQLTNILPAKGHRLPIIDHQTGDAHHLRLFPKVREVVQVEDLGSDIWLLRSNPLSGGHQLWAHSTEERYQDWEVHSPLDRMNCSLVLLIQSLSRPCLKSQNKGSKLVITRHAVKCQPCPPAVRPADPDAGQVFRISGDIDRNR